MRDFWSITLRRSLAVAILGVVVPALALDWSQFRFTPTHTGANKFEKTLGATTVRSLGLGWAAQLGELVDYSSPAVVGDTVYIGSSDGTLWAYPRDGCGNSLCTVPRWQSVPLAQIIDSPTVADGVVYIGSQTSPDSSAGKLSAFAASGCGHDVCAPLWQGHVGKESVLQSSPAVGGGMVFVGSFDGNLYAFAANGCGHALCDPAWKGRTGGHIESTPVVYKGRVYVGSDDGKLHVFDAAGCGAKTCSAMWTGRLGSTPFDSSPAIDHGKVYIGAQHAVSAFDAEGCGASKCEPLWQARDDTQFFNGSPAIANGHVYIGYETGLGVFAADGCGHKVCAAQWLLFGTGFQAAVVSSPTVANGVVYAGRNTGQVLAWSADPCGQGVCDEIWSATLPEQVTSSSPTVVDGRLYIGSADDEAPEEISGRLWVFELAQ